jgi:hypothetical protein
MIQENEYMILSEQLKGLTTLINAQFLEVHDRLDKINGKVAKHDDQIIEILIEKAVNKQEQKTIVSEHILTCPVSKDLNILKGTLEDLNFFVRHPKLFIGILVVIVILTLGIFIESNPLKVFVKDTSTITTPIEQTK